MIHELENKDLMSLFASFLDGYATARNESFLEWRKQWNSFLKSAGVAA